MIRLVIATAVIQMTLYYFFTRSFLGARESKLWFFVCILSAFVTIIVLSPWFISGIKSGSGRLPVLIFEIGIIPFLGALIFFVGGGLVNLFRAQRNKNGIQQKQILYVLTGSAIMFSLIISLSFASSALLKNSDFNIYTPLYTIPFIGFTSYAMLRYRFLGMSYGILRLVSVFIPFAFGILLELLVLINIEIPSTNESIIQFILVSTAFLTSVIIVSKGFIEKAITSYYLKPAEARDRLTAIVNKYHSLQRFRNAIWETAKEVYPMRVVTLFVVNRKGEFESENQADNLIKANDPLLKYFNKFTSLLIRDEIPLMRFAVPFIEDAQALKNVAIFMENKGFDFAVPLGRPEQLIGIIFLTIVSDKKSMSNVVSGLEALQSDATIGLQNLLLYRTSLDLIGIRNLK